jgi:hypothetical protein
LSGSEVCCPRGVEKHDRKGSDGDFAARYVVICPLCTRCPRYSQLVPKSTENGDARLSGLATQRDEGAESTRCERIRTATRDGGEIGLSEMKGANRVAID